MDRSEARQRRRAKIREFLKPKLTWALMLFLLMLKPFRFLLPLLPQKLQDMANCWDASMLRSYVFSFGTRVFMDQNCVWKPPASPKPLAQVDPQFRLSEAEIQSFYTNGFLGPITLWTPEEMAELRPKLEAMLKTPSSIYPDASNPYRDRHLESALVWAMVDSPQVKERFAQLLGPDLLVWRSQAFIKHPGDAESTWHQGSTFMPERKYKASLEPEDINELFELACWIAIDDVDFSNGCLHFIRGSQKKMWTIKRGGEGGLLGEMNEAAKLIAGSGKFAKVQSQMTLEAPVTPETVVAMPLKAGQCVFFTERCIHGAPPNRSDRRRFAMVFRAVKPSVKVYRGDTEAGVAALQEVYDLKNWGCVLLRGQNWKYYNKMRQPPHI